MNHILAAATLALILGAPGFANAQSDDAFLDKPCRDLIDAGWSKMPDVASYVMSKPGASRLGYGSECHKRVQLRGLRIRLAGNALAESVRLPALRLRQR